MIESLLRHLLHPGLRRVTWRTGLAGSSRVAVLSGLAWLAVPSLAPGTEPETIDAGWLRSRYDKQEVMVPTRDGVRLFTSIYTPKDRSKAYPFLLLRTPYGCRPYGVDVFPDTIGPCDELARDGYIFVVQDVRGTYMSDGEFVNMRPHRARKDGPQDVDESSDTYDTIEWLLANVDNDNGRAGQWGISYPGFYAAAGMIDAHPALRAVSPQAPIADWFFDDFHHHGAFFLPHAFNFLASFGLAREGPTTERNPRFDHGTPDGYQFFLDLGPLANADRLHFDGRVAFWNEICTHPNYDAFWQERNLLPHLNDVAPAVMTVGGWFDAEDLYGPLQIYRSIEARNDDVFNVLVMGPWSHGGWRRSDGDRLGRARFGGAQSLHYRDAMLRPFFQHYLKDGPAPDLAEANVFETGANRWRRFDAWPPADVVTKRMHLRAGGRLSFAPPSAADEGFDAFVSDPARPVPFTETIARGMTREYMTDDQRFASRRPDVLVWQTDVLTEDVTLAGPLLADLWVSTSESAADWIVKLIDVLPDDAKDPDGESDGWHAGGAQMMVRSEVMRGRFRDGYEHPKPFVPDERTRVRVPLQDVLHTFAAGHRVMIQVQSTWFPLVDRNPQRYVDNVFEAEENDFVAATHRVFRGPNDGSSIEVLVLPSVAVDAGQGSR